MSRSPEVTLFTRLRDNWNLVPCYIPGDAEPPFLGKLHAELNVCAAGVLDYKRGDYREFVQLCLVYLGAVGAAQTQVTFQQPGAMDGQAALKLALMEQHIALLPEGTITIRQQLHYARLRNVVADL